MNRFIERLLNNGRTALNIKQQIDNPEKKRDFNQRHFSAAATRYDMATKAMSLGRDQSWKKQLVALLPELTEPRCADLACGTGDVTFLLAVRFPDGRISGIDITADMIDIAHQRNHHSNVSFYQRDMEQTGFADQSIDIITGSYALRNAADPAQAVKEVHRILKPGGYAAFLDFSKDSRPARQRAQYWLLKCWCGLWGTLLHANPTIHAYIADSLEQFPAREDWHQLLKESGFELITSRSFYFGMLETVLIRKKG